MSGIRDGILGSVDSTTTASAMTVTGNTILGDAGSDTVTMTALMTVASSQKIQFRDTGLYINSGADGKLTISADGTGADDLTIGCTTTCSDDITMTSTAKVLFRDTALYISSINDGYLDVAADTAVRLNTPLVDLASAGILAGLGTGTNGFKIKNPKNAATGTLSGTALDVEIDIGGTPYYFHVYPTKT